MTAASQPDAATLLARLSAIVGPQHALTGEQDTRRFRKGHRTGGRGPGAGRGAAGHRAPC